jgi:hypothetical protein
MDEDVAMTDAKTRRALERLTPPLFRAYKCDLHSKVEGAASSVEEIEHAVKVAAKSGKELQAKLHGHGPGWTLDVSDGEIVAMNTRRGRMVVMAIDTRQIYYVKMGRPTTNDKDYPQEAAWAIEHYRKYNPQWPKAELAVAKEQTT